MGISDTSLTTRLRHNHILAISTGLVYLWFGYLKFMPGCSPAEELAKSTIHKLTFGMIPDHVSIILLAIWEVTIGALLILNIFRKQVVYAAIVHLVLTFTPFLFFPEITFTHPPLGYSLIGQYIAKNVILIAGMITLLRQQHPEIKA